MSGPLSTGVTIGSVTLLDFEIPDVMPWGTRQAIKEFIYPGGQNLLQTLGPSREPIKWSGQMIAPNATDRARALDQIAAAGQPVSLLWGDLCFNGLVERFTADYKHQWQGHYSIEFRPISDYQQKAPPDDPQGASANDLNSASTGLQSTQTALVGVSSGEGYVQQVAPVLASVSLALASAALAASAVTTVQQGLTGPGTLNATQAGIQAALASIGAASAISGGVLISVAPGPNSIGEITNAAGAAAGCATAFAYTARAAINWTQVPGIATPSLAMVLVQPDLSNYPGA